MILLYSGLKYRDCCFVDTVPVLLFVNVGCSFITLLQPLVNTVWAYLTIIKVNEINTSRWGCYDGWICSGESGKRIDGGGKTGGKWHRKCNGSACTNCCQESRHWIAVDDSFTSHLIWGTSIALFTLQSHISYKLSLSMHYFIIGFWAWLQCLL